MRRLLPWASACLLLGGAALAAPATERPVPPPRVFLSPSGEPFRLGPTMPDPLKAWFDQADVSHLGYLDRAEFRADAARFFKQLDTNGDGVVDGFELANYEAKIVPELADWSEGIPPPGEAGGGPRGHGDSGADGGHHGGHGGEHDGEHDRTHGHGPRTPVIAQLINEPEPVSDADFNFDSHITLSEWLHAADQRFDLLDQAHAGRLTLEALRTRLAHATQPHVATPRPETPPTTGPDQRQPRN
jgi:hypothetical protein